MIEASIPSHRALRAAPNNARRLGPRSPISWAAPFWGVALGAALSLYALSCGPTPAKREPKTAANHRTANTKPAAMAPSAGPLSPGDTASGKPATGTNAAAIPETPAGKQLAAWLEAFNSGDRTVLLAYHDRAFPYAAASRDVSNIEREHGLSQGTRGFDVRRVKHSEEERLVVLLQERRGPQHARVELEVAAEPPHVVTRFHIQPVPTPLDLLSPGERSARLIDAAGRKQVIASIGEQLKAHYVFEDVALGVTEALQRLEARGDYDELTDKIELARALTQDLRRLARDKHIGLRFGPMPPQPPEQLESAPEPPWLARIGYGFGPIERLDGNVAHVVIHGFPPPFPAVRRAIAERMNSVANADAVLLDLRENHGGWPSTVKLVASYFFGTEPVHLNDIYRRDTDHTLEMWSESDLEGERFGANKPVFVLTSRHTFSGGEGLAYALQAQRRARVVGEGTAGGAHPTEPYPVEGGFVLAVPWGRAVNPITGTNWEGIGVLPDVPTAAEEALEEAHRLALQALGKP